ncbi:alpha/beta hydrolase [Simiduia agarivorans]|uniref:Esterase n=1 Tax=Simiduia agarivorans (strain DSM 21679 / JCM 13881 / BCRC 17597 / SA1) TaxID=1117647 RepID=K4KJJ9_SIMAS|nr:alpha/beta hydrolase-fold protein [Simiduia agarivorans]AFU99329.1 putative esterase [Simiduia agarivorans SA1 = DSM 21679]
MNKWLSGGLLLCAGVLLGALGVQLTEQWTHNEPVDRPSTAVARVQVHTLAMPSLNRERAVRVYLPPSYADNTERHYPVLYLHDGQNLFDEATSFLGEWSLDETLDALAVSHGLEIIAIGIDNGAELRAQELIPWPHPELPVAEGDRYLDFIEKTLKPWADNRFRTRTAAEHTAILGSSLGGLISHYAAHTRPQLFGKAGVLSPSYWVSEQSFAMTQPNGVHQRLLFLMGEKEGGSMVPDFDRMQQLMRATNTEDTLLFHTVAHGQHNETLWRTHLGWVLLWLFPGATY